MSQVVPKIEIGSPCAKRKGVIEVASVADIEALRAELDEAESMLRRALEPEPRDPRVTEKVAELAPRVRELSEAAAEPEPLPDLRPCPAERDGRLCVMTMADHDEDERHQDAGGWRWSDAPPRPRPVTLEPRDESLPWAQGASERCGWSGPGGDRCRLRPHGPGVMHASPVGAGSMRRWAALRAVGA